MQPFDKAGGMRPNATKVYEEENPDSDGDGLDTEDEAHFQDYFWKPSITSGSSFVAGTLVPVEEVYPLRDHVGEED